MAASDSRPARRAPPTPPAYPSATASAEERGLTPVASAVTSPGNVAEPTAWENKASCLGTFQAPTIPPASPSRTTSIERLAQERQLEEVDGEGTRQEPKRESFSIRSGVRRLAHEPARYRLELHVVLQRAVVAARQHEQARGLVGRREQLLAHGVRHLLVPAGMQESSAVSAPSFPAAAKCGAIGAMSPGRHVAAKARGPVRARSARARSSSVAGQIATTATAPGREPRHRWPSTRHARSAERHRASVRAEELDPSRARRPARPVRSPSERPWPRVVGHRGHALVRIHARSRSGFLRRPGTVKNTTPASARPGAGRARRKGRRSCPARAGRARRAS